MLVFAGTSAIVVNDPGHGAVTHVGITAVARLNRFGERAARIPATIRAGAIDVLCCTRQSIYNPALDLPGFVLKCEDAISRQLRAGGQPQ